MKTKILIIGIIGLFCIMFVSSQTIPQTQTVLESYFVTGNVPTQTNFEELIGTMFYLYQETVANSAAAASNALVAAQNAPRTAHAYGTTVLSTNGCYLVITNWGGPFLQSNTLYFVPPMQDTNFIVISGLNLNSPAAPFTIVQRTTNWISWTNTDLYAGEKSIAIIGK